MEVYFEDKMLHWTKLKESIDFARYPQKVTETFKYHEILTDLLKELCASCCGAIRSNQLELVYATRECQEITIVLLRTFDEGSSL